MVNIQCDNNACYIGHYPLLAYFAVAENESNRYNFMQNILSCCGLPPREGRRLKGAYEAIGISFVACISHSA
ncbi:Uncharacterized protein AXF42_Ash004024 [Apostasia shenzhenica]|uniref:Uncharacterized protein n=1 Tax=Apostasia shenzhenica TaxID=1088818 RepID=A0A2I0A1T9_9ASPA|nr:Uncharacterized protein AXF42_Ash004024 [Apostasia shenzhenica]